MRDLNFVRINQTIENLLCLLVALTGLELRPATAIAPQDQRSVTRPQG